MTNPYQPPHEQSENRMAQLLVPGTYVGGFWAVTALGILAGVLVAVVMFFGDFLNGSGVLAWVAPAVGWVGTFAILLSMLTGSQIDAARRILFPLLLAIPAYILYVPVCTFSAMFSTSFMGSIGYGPSFAGLTLASVIGFVGILLIFAAVLRYRFKKRVDPEASANPGLPAVGPSDFTTPIE